MATREVPRLQTFNVEKAAMTDHPLLFSAPMVRALLDGSKTQDRRVITPTPGQVKAWGPDFAICSSAKIGTHADYDERWVQFEHPLGGPYTAIPLRPDIGDQLWVKETWRAWSHLNGVRPVDLPHDLGVQYVADDYKQLPWDSKTRVSIHMPRWASRITLLVTDVRVERLRDITEADAIAEGVKLYPDGWHWETNPEPYVRFIGKSARDAYFNLWNSINGTGSWEANPWVTATTFDVVQTNIGEL